jgi:hypothetical protein
LYRAAPGKEKDLMIPVTIMQLEAIEAILKSNNIMTEEKKKQIDAYRQELTKLSEGLSMSLIKKTTDTNNLTA